VLAGQSTQPRHHSAVVSEVLRLLMWRVEMVEQAELFSEAMEKMPRIW
jgi:hypothetical protein